MRGCATVLVTGEYIVLENISKEYYTVRTASSSVSSNQGNRKFKVALNPMYRLFLNFAKSCVLSCLSNVDNIKKFHRAVFEL